MYTHAVDSRILTSVYLFLHMSAISAGVLEKKKSHFKFSKLSDHKCYENRKDVEQNLDEVLTVFIDFLNELLEYFLVKWLPHHPENIRDEVARDAA